MTALSRNGLKRFFLRAEKRGRMMALKTDDSADRHRGCAFFNSGSKHALFLIVAVHSLRRHYSGPITVYLVPDESSPALEDLFRKMDCEVTMVNNLRHTYLDRHRLLLESPYRTTLFFDSDLLFRAPIDDLWEPIENEGVLVTRFYCPAYGVEGTPVHPGWSCRRDHLRAVAPFLEREVYETSVRRLLNEKLDLNVGVLGVARPKADEFLQEWMGKIEEGLPHNIILLDEMLAVALINKHNHFIADEPWNCPADEYFRRTNLRDAKIIHYFADGNRVNGSRLGRNPATWAGRQWYQAYRVCAHSFNLKRWEKADPGFSGPLKRLFSHGIDTLPHAAFQGIRRRRRGLQGRVIKEFHANVHYPIYKKILRARSKTNQRERLGSSEKATVVILSYKRIENIPVLVETALLCDFVEKVVVCNNNPDIDLTETLKFSDPRFELVQQSERRRPSYRFEVALEHPSDHYLCIDDDVFPSPRQLKQMLLTLLRNPEIPVGSAGQLFDPTTGHFPGVESGSTTPGSGREVDVIIQTYCFSQAHLERYFELLDLMGMKNDSIHSSEDVILSFAGTGKPVVVDAGRVLECPSSLDPHIATHRQAGFDEFRTELYHKLEKVTS